MSREILFRAWSKKRNVLEEVDVVNGKAVRKGYQWFLADNDVHDSKLEQYTGLTDKNGVKIFEGDKVKFKFIELSGIIIELIGYFYFEEFELRYQIEILNDPIYICLNYMFDKMDEFEVIGNIHEVENER